MRPAPGLFLLAALLTGCGDEPAPQPPAQPPPNGVQREVNKVGAASAVGYDGEAMQRAVQRTVDAQEERNRQAAEAAQEPGQ